MLDLLRTRLISDKGRPTAAYRVFNGFTEGVPGLAIDRYGKTLVIFEYAKGPFKEAFTRAKEIASVATESSPEIASVLLKARSASNDEGKKGILITGTAADVETVIEEHGIRYSIDLMLQQDAAFYLDTADLRVWAKENATDKRVLNLFSYTGSLGVAAACGGALSVLQSDKNGRYLAIAKQSAELNAKQISGKHETRAGDFFALTAQLRRKKDLFDLVLVDPPFFASAGRGRVDLEKELHRLIAKVQPLVAHQGKLVIVCNALFVSGREFEQSLLALEAGGYMKRSSTIDVPAIFHAQAGQPAPKYPTDPSPFSHPTKIAVLDVTRKDERTS